MVIHASSWEDRRTLWLRDQFSNQVGARVMGRTQMIYRVRFISDNVGLKCQLVPTCPPNHLKGSQPAKIQITQNKMFFYKVRTSFVEEARVRKTCWLTNGASKKVL